MRPNTVALFTEVPEPPTEKFLAPLRERFGNRFRLVAKPRTQAGRLRVYRSIADLPERPDVAVIDLSPAEDVLAAADACGHSGVPFAMVTANFQDFGDQGGQLESELLHVVRSHGMRLLGPNASLNLYEAMPAAEVGVGRIGLITQSGHMGRVIFQSAAHGVAFSRWIPIGNELDLETADFIEYLAGDPDTAVVAGYFEGFRDGASLRRALGAAAAAGKAVVMIKVGRHSAAARMAVTHSAHLTGSDRAFDGLCRQYGVIRVADVDELIETAALFAKVSPPAGDGIALYGISGGAVALMADQAESHGMVLPVLSESTQSELNTVLPGHLGVSNPVDPGNLYRTGTEADRRKVLETLGSDPAISVVVCALTGVIGGITDDFVADIVRFRDATEKTVVTTWNTWDMDTPAYATLVRSGIPIFRSFRGCFGALSSLIWYRDRRADAASRPLLQLPPIPASVERRLLTTGEAGDFLASCGIPVVAGHEVLGEADLVAAMQRLRTKAVLKAEVPGIVHKTEHQLVELDLDSPQKAAAAYHRLRRRVESLATNAEAIYHLQQQVSAGIELIVGLARDDVLGPVLVLGAGGVLAEILDDVSVRPLPVTPADVTEMVAELRIYRVLLGARGMPPANLRELERVLLAVATAGIDPSARLLELDLNPVFASPEAVVAVDHVVVVAP